LSETLGMSFTADEYLRAFFNAFADVGLHSLVLLLRHHRADSGLWISRIAGGKGADCIQDRSFHLVEAGLRYKEPRPSNARLSAVHKRDCTRRGDSLVHVGVVEQDVRRLAAQFEGDALHRRGAVAHDGLANAYRA